MEKTYLRLIFVLLFNLTYNVGFGQSYDFIKVIAGTGIVFNDDSILIDKASIHETCKILNINDVDDSDLILMSMWDGFDPKTGEMTSGAEWIREIKYKTIVFEFASDNDKYNLKLRWIRIGEDKTLKVYTENGLEMGAINPKITEFYPRFEKHDYISDNALTYNFYTHGISLQLEKLNSGDLKVIEISTHIKLE